MKNSKHTLRKTLLLTSASTLALTSSIVYGQQSTGSKTDEGSTLDPIPQLKLNQFVKPVDAFVPSLNDDDVDADGSMYEDDFEGYSDKGMLFVGEIPEDGARMDFIVGNIRNDVETVVYLVMGTELAASEDGSLFPGLTETGMDNSDGDMPMDDGMDNSDGDMPMDDGMDNSDGDVPMDNGMENPDDSMLPMDGGMDNSDGSMLPSEENVRDGERNNLEQHLEELYTQLDMMVEQGVPEDQLQEIERQIERVEQEMLKTSDSQGSSGFQARPGTNPAPPVRAGQICVDLADPNFQILAGVRLKPVEPAVPDAPNKLGEGMAPKYNSTILSVKLSKQLLMELQEGEVFFQVAALPTVVPEGGDVVAEAQVSECDRYLIAHPVEADETEGYQSSTGTKVDPEQNTTTEPTESTTPDTGSTSSTSSGSKVQ